MSQFLQFLLIIASYDGYVGVFAIWAVHIRTFERPARVIAHRIDVFEVCFSVGSVFLCTVSSQAPIGVFFLIVETEDSQTP